MGKKVGAVCVILCILILIPLVGFKVISSQNYTAEVNAQEEAPVTEDMQGVWIASVLNIDFPSKVGLTAEQQMQEIDSIIENTKYMGLNTIFFQVRPTGDALYKSSIFPWSTYLTGEQGKTNDKEFDPLAYIVEQGHKNGIKIHAWVNPLRLSMGTTQKPDKDISKLAKNHPVRNISHAVVAGNDGRLYLDPGYPEAIKLITDGVAEIVKNYDVDGIQFDDYFYPQQTGTKDFEDKASYEKYKGSTSSKEEWRRNNINNLVKSTYDTIKSIKPGVQFGMSPFGVWSNKDRNSEGSDTKAGVSTYYDHYADSKAWVKGGYIDYIAPQIYWSIGFQPADYAVLLNWWKDVCKDTKVKLYTGQAAYKINDSSQANEWLDPLQIPKQIALNRKSNAVHGSIFYGYAQLKNNVLGIKEKLRGIYVLGNNADSSVPEERQIVIAQPQNNYKTKASKVSILGSCDPRQPLYMNEKVVETSKDGYFTAFVDLQVGENNFVFKHKDNEIILKIVREDSEASPYTMNAPEFKPGSVFPEQSSIMKTGQIIDFSCVAPAGAKVWVEIGKYKVELKGSNKADTKDAANSGSGIENTAGKYIPTSFKGKFTLPKVAGKERNLSLGKPIFVLEYKGQRVTKKMSNTISVQSDKYFKYAVIDTKGSYEIPSRTGPSATSRLTPQINGAVDYITGQQNGYYLLKSGMWVSGSDIKIINDKSLAQNKVKYINLAANGGYTDVSFKMPVNCVFDVAVAKDVVSLTLFNTIGIKAGATIPSNAIFSTLQCINNADGSTKYNFKLKAPDKYYGYEAKYTNGSLTFSLKNAPKVAATGSKPLKGLTVLLDAGHGGDEWGAVGPLGKNGLYEKQINLAITLNAKKYLQTMGAKVIMSRGSDKTVSLTDRANMIRKEKPDIAVSIHNNSMDVVCDYSKYKGVLTLYSKDSSKIAAAFVKNALVNDLQRADDDTRWQSLSVCTVTQSPAILIECGYLSNPEEYEWLTSYDNQAKVGTSIGKAIEKWAVENSK